MWTSGRLSCTSRARPLTWWRPAFSAAGDAQAVRHMGRHYPAMSMIFVADLLDHPAKIELEATAVLPPGPIRV